MNILVHKYGGSSVADLQKIDKVATHIKLTLTESGAKIVCVISAMGSQTNELLGLAKALNPDPPKREVDMLLSVGERTSAALLAISLAKHGVRAVSYTGSQVGILTDSVHTNARIQGIRCDRLLESLRHVDVVVVAGFQGVDPKTKEITTLGRGGSDLTAVALAKVLGAVSCDIFTDVLGICTADPRIVPNAKTLDQVSWATASELAWNGAKVLHARAAQLGETYRVPIRKRSMENLNHLGTSITENERIHKMENAGVTAITHRLNMEHLRVEMVSSSVTSAIQSWLWQEGYGVQYLVSRVSEDAKWFADVLVPQELSAGISRVAGVTVTKKQNIKNLGLIAVVGHGFLQDPRLVAQIESICSAQMYLCEVRNQSILVAADADAVVEIVRTLHKELIEKIQYILLDIEGTTLPVSFVHDVLFPYAASQMQVFLETKGTDPEVALAVQNVRDICAAEGTKVPQSSAQVAEVLKKWIREDRKQTDLKLIQGKIWKDGYSRSEFYSPLYDDVVPALKFWLSQGYKLGVYSSGSVEAQKLLYAHTKNGDVCSVFSDFFDTGVGGKKVADSYKKIASNLGLLTSQILFLSDIEEELIAASSAGMKVAQIVRDDKTKKSQKFKILNSLGDIEVER